MATIPSQQMSVPEILSQISTFIAAGHETTSAALAWCLYALSRSPHSQRKLCAVVRSLDAASPALDEQVMQLPYLDWVVRESLRVHAPVTSTMRVCLREGDAIPVGAPYEDRKGLRQSVIQVRKGDMISIPIQAINKSRKLWGEDALLFRFGV
jgi:cytochrome P450